MSKAFEASQAAQDRWAKLNALGYSRTMFWIPHGPKHAVVFHRATPSDERVVIGGFDAPASADLAGCAENINRCCEIAEAHRKDKE